MASLLQRIKIVFLIYDYNFMQQIKGTQIKNLITKFYYSGNQLCFQILIHCESDHTIKYRDYSDYSAYKKAYDKLLKAKSEGALISIPGTKAGVSHIDFV